MDTNDKNTVVLRRSSENLLTRRKSTFSVKNENNLVDNTRPVRNSNSLLSICSNDFDQFKEEIEKRIQKREEEREKNRKLMKEEIKREKDLIKKMHNMKNGEGGEKKKKIFFNEKEFYGVSFEKPEKDEIIDLKKRSKTDNKSKKLTKKMREHQGDIFIKALTKCINKDNITTTLENDEPSVDSPKSKRLSIMSIKNTQVQHDQRAMWDTTDVFPVGIGETEGIDIFRIEDLGVAMVDPDDYGSFSTGDCYIILNTYKEDKELKHRIHQWIGKQAENDKLFCSAIYSVMLKGLINETENIIREVEGDESDELRCVFSSDIRYLDYSDGAESRLSSPYEIQYPLRMYKIFEKGKIHLVETSHLMFDTNCVFIIDNGLELYQWNGKQSSNLNRVFGSILLKRINSNERNNKAEVKEFEEFEEDSSFWDLFEEERTEENAAEFEELANEKYEKIFEVAKQPSKLYKVPDIESLDDIDCESYLEAEGFFFDKHLLKSENCYVMDCGVELFLWTGKKASENCRYMVQEFTVKLIPNKVRPKWVGLHRFNENCENEIFTIRFFNWGIPEDADFSKLILPDNCYKGNLKIDASALFNTNPISTNFESSNQLSSIMNNANESLQAIYGFVFDPLSCNFVEITESEIGQFYSKNSYIFLCIYKVNNNETEDGENEDSDESDNENDSELAQYSSTKSHTIIGKKKTFNHKMNCIVYFWQGTMANRFAWLSFLYSKKDQIEAGTLAAYNEPLHVIILNQGSESLSFLSHLNNYCVYYKNKKLIYYDEANIINPLSYTCSNENINIDDESDKSIIYKKETIRMFHIQTNQKYKTTRAWEVDIKAESLVSRDCFLVIYNNIDFVYRDSESNSEQNEEEQNESEQNGNEQNENEQNEEEHNENEQNENEDESNENESNENGSNINESNINESNINEQNENEQNEIERNEIEQKENEHNEEYVPHAKRRQSNESYSTVTNKPNEEEVQFICDLWVGKGASKDEVRRAVELSKWISELMASDDPSNVKKPDNFGYDLNTIQNSNLSILDGKYQLNIIQEGSESDQFWSNLGVNINADNCSIPPSTSSSFYGTIDKRRTLIKNYSSSFLLNMKKKKLNIYYGKGTESWYMKPPRFFKCDCSQGYFSAREIENFSQYDLSDDSCIILDSNSPGRIYVWIGRNSSDVVRKLTQKSVEVWLTNVDDGRWYDNSFLTLSKNNDDSMTITSSMNNLIADSKKTLNGNENTTTSTTDSQEKKGDVVSKINNSLDEDPFIKRMKERRERKAKKTPKKSDVVIEYQGEESIDFKSFFFGWSEEVSKNIHYDPGNSYIREMAKKKKLREEKLRDTAEFYEPVIYELCNVEEQSS